MIFSIEYILYCLEIQLFWYEVQAEQSFIGTLDEYDNGQGEGEGKLLLALTHSDFHIRGGKIHIKEYQCSSRECLMGNLLVPAQ